jgi:hypothetical protein
MSSTGQTEPADPTAVEELPLRTAHAFECGHFVSTTCPHVPPRNHRLTTPCELLKATSPQAKVARAVGLDTSLLTGSQMLVAYLSKLSRLSHPPPEMISQT